MEGIRVIRQRDKFVYCVQVYDIYYRCVEAWLVEMQQTLVSGTLICCVPFQSNLNKSPGDTS